MVTGPLIPLWFSPACTARVAIPDFAFAISPPASGLSVHQFIG
jgi:hypothetical protein